MGAGEGADRPHIGVGVHHARLHQGGAHQIGALGDAGRSEAVAGPGEGVRADGDAGRGVRHRHGGEDLHGAVPAGVSKRRATADTGANTRSRGPGRPPLRCQRTRRSPRASWPANSMVAVPSSTTTTSGARVMVSSSCTYRENGSPRTTRRARRRGTARPPMVRSGALAPPRASSQRTSCPSSRASSAIRRSWPRVIGSTGDSTTRASPAPGAWACAHSSTLSSWTGLSTKASVRGPVRVARGLIDVRPFPS